MSESGFDVLKDFQPDGGSITFEPYKPFEETQNIVDYNTEKQAKNEISAEAAAQMVQPGYLLFVAEINRLSTHLFGYNHCYCFSFFVSFISLFQNFCM